MGIHQGGNQKPATSNEDETMTRIVEDFLFLFSIQDLNEKGIPIRQYT
jgi:hypothetical protein